MHAGKRGFRNIRRIIFLVVQAERKVDFRRLRRGFRFFVHLRHRFSCFVVRKSRRLGCRYRGFHLRRRIDGAAGRNGSESVLRRHNVIERACVAVQHIGNNAINAAVNDFVIGKAYVRFIRMHVDVYYFGRDGDVKHVKRILALHQIVRIGVCNGGGNRLIADISAV